MYLKVRKPPLRSKIHLNPLSFFFPRPTEVPPSPMDTSLSSCAPTPPAIGSTSTSVPIPLIPPTTNPRGELCLYDRANLERKRAQRIVCGCAGAGGGGAAATRRQCQYRGRRWDAQGEGKGTGRDAADVVAAAAEWFAVERQHRRAEEYPAFPFARTEPLAFGAGKLLTTLQEFLKIMANTIFIFTILKKEILVYFFPFCLSPMPKVLKVVLVYCHLFCAIF
ncbi:hypothetical protein C8R47DRAFT_1289603 [Mycena vitilis]|nr:hypothetical protein C8R47DRAFT_1289603 [Mycena vitilis]